MDDYGSAFASWLVNNIRDKQSIPQNEIIDWYVSQLAINFENDTKCLQLIIRTKCNKNEQAMFINT